MSSGNPAPTGLRDLGARLSTAIVIGIAFIAAILWGGRIGIGLVVGLVAVFATGEFYAILRRERRLPNESLGMIAVGVMPFAASVWGVPGLTTTLGALMIASLVWHITFSEVRASDTSVTVFGALYVGFTLAHIVLIRELPDGRVLALATVASVWANDTIAYLVGSSLGRHKLAPAISPQDVGGSRRWHDRHDNGVVRAERAAECLLRRRSARIDRSRRVTRRRHR